MNVKHAALQAALRNALGKPFFNLSGVDDAARLLGLPRFTGNEDWAIMQALHCTKWVEMDCETKVGLAGIVSRVLGLDLAPTVANEQQTFGPDNLSHSLYLPSTGIQQ